MLKLSLFAKPTSVISNLLARSIAKLVGAPTPTIIPMSDINAF